MEFLPFIMPWNTKTLNDLKESSIPQKSTLYMMVIPLGANLNELPAHTCKLLVLAKGQEVENYLQWPAFQANHNQS